VVLSERLIAWYVIGAGLLVEFVTVRWILRQPLLRAAVATLAMNGVSAVIGYFFVYWGGGVLFEATYLIYSMFDAGTPWIDDALGWVLVGSTLALAVAVNTGVEGGVLAMFKVPADGRMWQWLAAANTVSVGVAVISIAISIVIEARG
jgi:hypothetical protein